MHTCTREIEKLNLTDAAGFGLWASFCVPDPSGSLLIGAVFVKWVVRTFHPQFREFGTMRVWF